MNNWYNQENKDMWYKPLGYNPDDDWVTLSDRDAQNEAENRKNKKGRIIGIIALTAVLAAAGIFAAVSPAIKIIAGTENNDGAKDDNFGNYIIDPEKPAENLPDNFSDFFDAYFVEDETEVTDIRIKKTEEKSGFSVKLKDAAEELPLQELYKKCAPSITSIKGYKDGLAGYNWGTGVILSEDGIILTNTHVINDCDTCEVVLSDETVYPALLVGFDSISDLAVLKIDAKGLTPAQLGQSSALAVGDEVAAIGNPLGDSFTGTLTDGIISAIERDVTYNGRSMTLLQTNTALNEGNSGGALFNMAGQVVGITNMKMMSYYGSIEGIGFAIPSGTVQGVVNSIVKSGKVTGRPSIGVTVGQIPENIATHYEMPEGLYVSAVSEGSDAEKQGILAGDVILSADGIKATTANALNDQKNEKSVGDTMKFKIWRSGEELEIEVKLVDTNDIYK